MNSGWKKNPVRRWNLSKVATAATTAMISCCLRDAIAFTGLPVVTKPSFKINGVRQVYDSALFALVQGDDSVSNTTKKLTMELVTDSNRRTILNPPDSRPVLVDAFAPFCGPCKLLDKVLRRSQTRYVGKVNFCRWNVNDKENTRELKKFFIAEGYTLKKLPSLVLFRDGKPIAVRPGFANEFQLDDWLETTLPDHLERTFDENGVKMIPLPTAASQVDVVQKMKTNEKLHKHHLTDGDVKDSEDLMNIILETEVWHNRTVVPAMDGILLPTRP
mmetsp:Transcript_15832/g.32442  ORF Transcript_15832/g.32442 Transcript_15832/m.32442 type:complete len:274 (+) Transcript_15832:381-1202(+)